MPAGSATPVSPVRVGVVSFHSSTETRAILHAVRSLGHEPVWLREDNTRTWIHDGRIRFRPDVDVVVNRLLASKADRPLDDLGLVMSYATARPVLNPPVPFLRAIHKYAAGATLAAAGLPVPTTSMAFTTTPGRGDDPIPGMAVHKPVIGTNGIGLDLVEPGATAPARIDGRRVLRQEFLPPTGDQPFDVRVYVVAGRIVGAMKRYAPAGDWRTNVARGGTVEDASDQLPPAAARYATQATRVIGLDYAGVDLLHHDGNWYILEVNPTAGFKGLFAATGTNPAPYIAQLAIQRAGRTVAAGDVADLTGTLDGATPAPTSAASCTRQPGPPATRRVMVSGPRGVERATARIDARAERSRIDADLASAIGTGPRTGRHPPVPREPADHAAQEVELDIRLGNRWHTTTAAVEDRSRQDHRILVGKDLAASGSDEACGQGARSRR